MSKIEIIIDKRKGYGLRVDGAVFPDEEFYIHPGDSDENFSITLFSETVVKIIKQCRFSDLPERCESLTMSSTYSVFQGTHIRHELTIHKRDLLKFDLDVNFRFNTDEWKHPWSIREYLQEYKRIAEFKPELNLRWTGESSIFYPLSFSFPVEDVESTIEAEALKHEGLLGELHELTEAALLEKLHSGSVVMSFDFPDEVKVACEQYLLYFAQFLRDLGVEANTALTHDAGQVLFTVTPENKQIALDKIHAALDVYLHLPSNPIKDATNESIAIQRLEANVLRLRGDLKLAAALIQAKNATIQAQELTISIQQGLLSGEIVVDSMKDVTPKPKDKEDLLGGMVSIKKYEGKGFDVNLPELYRQLKQLFSEKDKE